MASYFTQFFTQSYIINPYVLHVYGDPDKALVSGLAGRLGKGEKLCTVSTVYDLPLAKEVHSLYQNRTNELAAPSQIIHKPINEIFDQEIQNEEMWINFKHDFVAYQKRNIKRIEELNNKRNEHLKKIGNVCNSCLITKEELSKSFFITFPQSGNGKKGGSDELHKA